MKRHRPAYNSESNLQAGPELYWIASPLCCRAVLMLWPGRSIDGPTRFQAYVAYQLTFGPHFFSKHRAPSLWHSPSR